MATDPTTFDHAATLAELETLVRETYQLWDQEWVGFSWRNYTFDHAQRVCALTRTLCAREGGDVRVSDYAGLLHDITKSYDGEILMKDGKRVLDERGFWQNAVLPPTRHNRVTDLYDELGLAGMLHNVSGARLAEALLLERGLSAEFAARVAEAVRSHLKPDASASIEGRCLYDADTIDANIGLPAFYRNIQINMHREEGNLAQKNIALADYLRDNLEAYLNPYLRERIPTWLAGKHNDFIAPLTTESGKALARDRIERLNAVNQAAVEELSDFPRNLESGRLAIVARFLCNHRNPALSRELVYLSNHWQHEAPRSDGAADMVTKLCAEVRGEL